MVDCTKCKHFNNMVCDVGGNLDISTLNRQCEVYECVEGLKYDTGKNRMGLVLHGFSNALWEVGRVGTFGANKYGAENWQYLNNGIDRYKDALFRHLFQYMQGEEIDKESGLKHLSHALWNLCAVLEFELRAEKKQKELKDILLGDRE